MQARLRSTSVSLRYAPSPTGRLHIGNLRTAYVSHQIARSLGLKWQVRFEDIDRPRVIQDSNEQQLNDLKSLGLVPEKIFYQSSNHRMHYQSLLKILASGRAFACFCSRKDNEQSAPHTAPGQYSGACRKLSSMPDAQSLIGKNSVAWRLRDNDLIIGRSPLVQHLSEVPAESGFQPSYHFACALDDVVQNHLVIVRGADLASARLDQSVLYRVAHELKISESLYEPVFVHTRMVIGRQGERLEKRSSGVTLAELNAVGVDHNAVLEKFESSLDLSFLASIKLGEVKVYDEPGASIGIQTMGF